MTKLNPSQQRVLTVILAEPKSAKEISMAVGTTGQTAGKVLRGLQARGLVRKTGEGPHVRWRRARA